VGWQRTGNGNSVRQALWSFPTKPGHSASHTQAVQAARPKPQRQEQWTFEIVSRYLQQVTFIITFIGTANQIAATFLFSHAIMRLGQELISQ
jgi:hypothetical protein